MASACYQDASCSHTPPAHASTVHQPVAAWSQIKFNKEVGLLGQPELSTQSNLYILCLLCLFATNRVTNIYIYIYMRIQ